MMFEFKTKTRDDEIKELGWVCATCGEPCCAVSSGIDHWRLVACNHDGGSTCDNCRGTVCIPAEPGLIIPKGGNR
jgi:hypothetical protein